MGFKNNVKNDWLIRTCKPRKPEAKKQPTVNVSAHTVPFPLDLPHFKRQVAAQKHGNLPLPQPWASPKK